MEVQARQKELQSMDQRIRPWEQQAGKKQHLEEMMTTKQHNERMSAAQKTFEEGQLNQKNTND
jgi:hypothetical protein